MEIELFSPVGLYEYVLSKLSGQNEIRIDKLMYLVSLTYTIPLYNKSLLENDEGWVPFNGRHLQDCGLKDYRKHLNWLIDNDILETDNHYVVGKKSKSYRLTDKYLKADLDRIKIQTRIKSLQRTYPFKSSCWVERKLFSYLQEIKVDVNTFQDHNYLKLSVFRQNVIKTSTEYINQKKLYLKRDSTSKRLHHNLTNLNKTVRPYVRYKHEKLVSIDIINSQPFFATILTQNGFFLTKKELFLLKSTELVTFSEIIEYNLQLSDILPINTPSFMLSLLSKPSLDESFTKYVTHCSKGTFYEFLSSRMNLFPVKRSQVKKMIFVTFFSRNGFNHLPFEEAQLKRKFEHEFPRMYEIFHFIKSKSKKALAILLQSIESYVMLEIIVPAIIKRHPLIPIFTIHDSIVTTQSNEELISEIMEKEIFKLIGIKPALKVELWSQRIKIPTKSDVYPN